MPAEAALCLPLGPSLTSLASTTSPPQTGQVETFTSTRFSSFSRISTSPGSVGGLGLVDLRLGGRLFGGSLTATVHGTLGRCGG